MRTKAARWPASRGRSKEVIFARVLKLSDLSMDEAINRVTERLAEEGFGVLTTIDVRATLHKKLGVDFRPYVILGACNPTLAHQALLADPSVGLLLPCNVVVEQQPDAIHVHLVNPRALFGETDNPALQSLVADAERRLARVALGVVNHHAHRFASGHGSRAR